jgi:hypothetical protein
MPELLDLPRLRCALLPLQLRLLRPVWLQWLRMQRRRLQHMQQLRIGSMRLSSAERRVSRCGASIARQYESGLRDEGAQQPAAATRTTGND